MPLLMNIKSGYATRTRIEVFVSTKRREVDTPIVQRKRHVADGMGKIPTADTTLKVKEISERKFVIFFSWPLPVQITFSCAFFVIDSIGNHWPV